jgi:hypothetical protein
MNLIFAHNASHRASLSPLTALQAHGINRSRHISAAAACHGSTKAINIAIKQVARLILLFPIFSNITGRKGAYGERSCHHVELHAILKTSWSFI